MLSKPVFLPFISSLTFAAMTLLSATAHAACLAEQDLRAQMLKQVPDAVIVSVAPAPYIDELNALPPTTNIPAPAKVLVFASPSLPDVLIVGLDAQSCAVGKARLTTAQHHAIMRKIGPST